MTRRGWRVFTTTVVAAGVWLAWQVVGGSAETPPVESARGWRPNVEQPIRQLEGVLASLEQQQPRNYTITNIAFLYDALLYIELNERERLLSDTARGEFRSQQDRWRERRDELVRGAAKEYEGGSLAPHVAAEMSIKLTKERLAELQRVQPSP
jgi:hypothetical protein